MIAMIGLVGCGAGAPPEQGPVADDVSARVEGTWNGAIDAGGSELRIVFHLEAEGDGWTGTLDSPDQGAEGIPVDVVVPSNEGLYLKVSKVGGTYEGTWTDAGTLEGTWRQSIASLPLDLAKGEAPARKPRAQEPVPPFPYRTLDVTLDGAPGVSLGGTLLLPPGPGPHAAVVLVSGSGPQDRDEALMGHRPFLVLADAIVRQGVAVLRYDDRGVGASTGDFAAATTRDFAADAGAAVGWLGSRDDVDAERIGMVGHSEGGLVAPMVAVQGGLAFAVLLAGPGVTGKAVLEGQVEALTLAGGASKSEAAKARAQQGKLLQMLLDGASEAKLRAAMVQASMTEEAVDAQLPTVRSAWFRAFVATDPRPNLEALDIPVLALLAAKDLQVLPADNEPILRAALAGNPAATVEVLPGLNHLFQPAETGLPSEYGKIETTIDPAALARIAGWIREQAKVP